MGQRFAPHHRVEVACNAASAVRGDRDALEQALVHLVQNAIDASAPEAPVCLSVTADGLNARIDIVDVGEGMEPAFVRDKLFTPFVSSKSDGFGIGALEARELVRAMGGRLYVQSRVGLGTRFSIELPLAEALGIADMKERNEAA